MSNPYLPANEAARNLLASLIKIQTSFAHEQDGHPFGRTIGDNEEFWRGLVQLVSNASVFVIGALALENEELKKGNTNG